MSVQDLPSLHRRYVDLAGRFKAAWTFHQFLQGLQKLFVAAQIPQYPTDLSEIHAILKRASESLTGTAPDSVTDDLETAARQLDQTSGVLAAADVRVTPPLLRQFFERVKNYDDQILAQMVRFYLGLASDGALSGDRLDKVDFLVTRLSEETDPVSGAALLRDPTRLRGMFEGFWALLPGLTVEPSWVEERRSELAEFRRELSGVQDLASFSSSQIVSRYREAKRLLGRYLFHPELLLAVVETNLAFKNKVRRNFHDEEERILAESQRILAEESAKEADGGGGAHLGELRRAVQVVEREKQLDNLKIDDLAFLRRQLEELRPRIVRPTAAPTDATVTKVDDLGIDSELAPFVRTLVEALEGSDDRSAAKQVALSGELYEYRLEARDVTAYRRIFVLEEGDQTLERFLFESAALRQRINVGANEITELLDETAVTRESPVFQSARECTRMADTYVQRFGGFIDEAVRSGNLGEAQQLQLLRMRLIRDYSGLWLLVNRPSS